MSWVQCAISFVCEKGWRTKCKRRKRKEEEHLFYHGFPRNDDTKHKNKNKNKENIPPPVQRFLVPKQDMTTSSNLVYNARFPIGPVQNHHRLPRTPLAAKMHLYQPSLFTNNAQVWGANGALTSTATTVTNARSASFRTNSIARFGSRSVKKAY